MFSRTGNMIHLSRKVKGWTQEQLAEKTGVSSVAVSKWERGVNVPEIDVLCQLADLFELSVDELLGRVDKPVNENEKYRKEELEDYELGKKLLEYARIFRAYGWQAVAASAKKEKTDEFLTFAVTLLVDADRKGIFGQQLEKLLKNYSDKEKRKRRADMVCASLLAISEGAGEEVLREVIASHLGREYRDKLVDTISETESREAVLQQYAAKACEVDLLEDLADCDDRTIQLILRKLDNETLVSALYGASGSVCKKFLQNVSDRLLYFLTIDIRQYTGNNEEVRRAQKRILEIAVML